MAAREVWQQVKKTVKQMDSESMLKHCYVIQLARVQRMLDVKAESGEIANSVRKHEFGEEWTRGKGGAMPYGGPNPASLLPPAEGEPSEIEKKMATFEAVDRNLIRAATVRFVEMIEEGSGGKFKVSGLDAEFRRAARKNEGGSEPTAVSDVGTGS